MKVGLCFGLVCLLLWSCEHKELCYSHPHDKEWRVLFDWSQIPQEQIPDEVKVIFSPLWKDSTDVSLEFELSSEGGTVVLPDGDYEILAYNDNSYVNRVVHRKTDWSFGQDKRHWRFVMTTPDAGNKPRMKRAPDFFCLEEQIKRLDSNADVRELVLQPRRRTARVSYEVSGIRGMESARFIYGVLTGCSAHLDLSSGVCLERTTQGEVADVVFDMERTPQKLQGCFYLLGGGFAPGQRGKVEHRHFLEIHLQGADGRDWVLSKEVTEQVPCTNEIGVLMPDFHIRLDLHVNIPELSGDEESQFDPEVDAWEEEETEIPLG